HFQRNRDLPFDFLGARAWKLRNDLNDGRRRIGIGLDVDVQKRIGADGDQRDRQQADDQPVMNGPPDETKDHGPLPASGRPSDCATAVGCWLWRSKRFLASSTPPDVMTYSPISSASG